MTYHILNSSVTSLMKQVVGPMPMPMPWLRLFNKHIGKSDIAKTGVQKTIAMGLIRFRCWVMVSKEGLEMNRRKSHWNIELGTKGSTFYSWEFQFGISQRL